MQSGWAMSQYLPYSGFKWLRQNEIDKFCLNSIGGKSSIDYILEVDLEYPDQLHALNNDYPLAPEKLETSRNMLSNKYGMKIGGANKLVSNLVVESKYVLNYRNLQVVLLIRNEID